MKSRTLVVALAAVLVLTGCSSTPEPETTPSAAVESTPAETSSPTPTPSPEPTVETVETVEHDRGFILKEIGEEGGILSPSTNQPAVTFSLTEVESDFTCTNTDLLEPVNDEFIGLFFEVTVTSEFDPAEMMMDSFTMYPYDFQVFRADGSRVNDAVGNGYNCPSRADSLPTEIGKGQSASGWFVIDVPSDAVAVAYTIDGAGWEWQLP